MILPQVNIRKILYATDLSQSARYAFAWAVNLANQYQAKLVILHVISEDPGLDRHVIGYISEADWEEIKNRHFEDARSTLIGKKREGVAIREVLDQFCEDMRTSLGEDCQFETDESLVKVGHPVEQILHVAEDRKCDLIVMGSHGYGVLKDAMMGGTARRVLRRSKKPVLLVRLPEDAD